MYIYIYNDILCIKYLVHINTLSTPIVHILLKNVFTKWFTLILNFLIATYIILLS